jgi:hypothetical protein
MIKGIGKWNGLRPRVQFEVHPFERVVHFLDDAADENMIGWFGHESERRQLPRTTIPGP